jgi:ubiquinone/menaquinone biosynthesis C-methylase UbiE
MEDTGQSIKAWSDQWRARTPESEIRMWDFYGGRQWISKFIPRFGKTLEAGCGLGRYNFYFSRMGIDIEGIDFSESTINLLKRWQKKYKFKINFNVAHVSALPYNNGSLRGYLSLGVLEHFAKGPQIALKEAFRVLEPGGIAIITTPSVSWNVLRQRIIKSSKNILKTIIFYPIPKEPFIQYEYAPHKLRAFIQDTGFVVTEFGGADLLYSFHEYGKYSGNNIHQGSFAYWVANTFEKTSFRILGAQAIAIGIKPSKDMYCFLCGDLKAEMNTLQFFSVPICGHCVHRPISRYYQRHIIPKYASPYLINPPIKHQQLEICHFSDKKYWTDELFEDFGFSKKVSPDFLVRPEINIELCNNFIQPIWRKRGIISIEDNRFTSQS